MSYIYKPFQSGGIDFVQEEEPNPVSNSTWVKPEEHSLDHLAPEFNVQWTEGSLSADGADVNDGTVAFYRSWNNRVKVGDAETGDFDWQHDHHESSPTSVHVGSDAVYSGDTDGKLVAADIIDGTELWTYDVGSSIDVRGIVEHSNGNFVNVISADGYIHMLDSSDGSKIYDNQLFANSGHDLYIVGGYGYAVGDDLFGENAVKSFYASDGEEVWSHDIAGERAWSVKVSDGVVYSGHMFGNREVVAADASDGSEIWTHSYHDRGVHILAVTDDFVISWDGDEQIIAANVSDGSQEWTIDASEEGFDAATHEDGTFYYESNVGIVAATLQAQKSREWKLRVSDGVNWYSVPSPAFIVDDDGTRRQVWVSEDGIPDHANDDDIVLVKADES